MARQNEIETCPYTSLCYRMNGIPTHDFVRYRLYSSKNAMRWASSSVLHHQPSLIILGRVGKHTPNSIVKKQPQKRRKTRRTNRIAQQELGPDRPPIVSKIRWMSQPGIDPRVDEPVAGLIAGCHVVAEITSGMFHRQRPSDLPHSDEEETEVRSCGEGFQHREEIELGHGFDQACHVRDVVGRTVGRQDVRFHFCAARIIPGRDPELHKVEEAKDADVERELRVVIAERVGDVQRECTHEAEAAGTQRDAVECEGSPRIEVRRECRWILATGEGALGVFIVGARFVVGGGEFGHDGGSSRGWDGRESG